MKKPIEGLLGFTSEIAGYYRDIKVHEASPDGTARIGGPPEATPDQSSINVRPLHNVPTVKPPSATLNIGGVDVNKTALIVTGGALATILVLKVLKP